MSAVSESDAQCCRTRLFEPDSWRPTHPPLARPPLICPLFQETLPYLHPGLRPEPQDIDGVEVNPDAVIIAEVDSGWGPQKGPSPLGRGRSRRQQAQGNWRNLSSNVRKAIEAEEAEALAAGSISPSDVKRREAEGKREAGTRDGKPNGGKAAEANGNGNGNGAKASAPQNGGAAGSSWPMAEPCSSMKSPKSRPPSR